MAYDAVLIAGPTASGKSAAALALAEGLRGTIVNADSMQMYRELRVLTARPSAEDEARVPHLLYGWVPAGERYSAGRYQDDAMAALDAVRQAGRLPIFVGGTGLYFDVLTKGLSPVPSIAAEARARVRRRFESLGREEFLAELIARDPGSAKLRITDTHRLMRAADVLESTGRPLSAWQEASGKPVLEGLKVGRFVIAPPRAVLAERIAARVDAMMTNGAIEEAAALVKISSDLPAARALGLAQLWRYLVGDMTLEDAKDEIATATRQYVKRQMTWFRTRMKDWKWLESDNLCNNIAQLKECCL